MLFCSSHVKNRTALQIIVLFFIIFFIFSHHQSLQNLFSTSTQEPISSSAELQQAHSSPSPSAIIQSGDRYAYATFLTHSFSSEYLHHLEAVRILIFQLKFDSTTKSPAAFPVLVICTTSVPETDQIRLREWGADIIAVFEPEIVPWQVIGETRWVDVMTKIRLHDFTNFDRILFLDADTILTRPLDGVFYEPQVTAEQVSMVGKSAARPSDAEMPARFVFTAVHDMSEHYHWPPVSNANGDYWGSDDYMNAGFYVIKPDPAMLVYYRSLMIIEGRFPTGMPEQGLFNYAHRQYGSMPWQVLDYTWNMHFPALEDLEGGSASLHDKWWNVTDVRLKPYFEDVRQRALRYYGRLV